MPELEIRQMPCGCCVQVFVKGTRNLVAYVKKLGPGLYAGYIDNTIAGLQEYIVEQLIKLEAAAASGLVLNMTNRQN